MKDGRHRQSLHPLRTTNEELSQVSTYRRRVPKPIIIRISNRSRALPRYRSNPSGIEADALIRVDFVAGFDLAALPIPRALEEVR
jgi:hypothetical protein